MGLMGRVGLMISTSRPIENPPIDGPHQESQGNAAFADGDSRVG